MQWYGSGLSRVAKVGNRVQITVEKNHKSGQESYTESASYCVEARPCKADAYIPLLECCFCNHGKSILPAEFRLREIEDKSALVVLGWLYQFHRLLFARETRSNRCLGYTREWPQWA